MKRKFLVSDNKHMPMEWATFSELQKRYGKVEGKVDGDDFSDYKFMWGFKKNGLETNVYVFQEEKKPYSLKEDHKQLKLLIKDAEKRIDWAVRELGIGKRDVDEVINVLDNLSQDLMAVNM